MGIHQLDGVTEKTQRRRPPYRNPLQRNVSIREDDPYGLQVTDLVRAAARDYGHRHKAHKDVSLSPSRKSHFTPHVP